ncbi:MAG: hypothetical protein EBR92_09780, partial [Alphaproteobacteria bacterium]|nr:hypothetical protein [Alphaproteobacteria bacterium]
MAKTSEPRKASARVEKTARGQTGDGATAGTARAGTPSAGKSRGLGRGLSSLLGDAGIAATTGAVPGASLGASPQTAAPAQTGLTELPIEWINSGPWQPRRRFDTASLSELAESIRSKGLVQPILVRPRAGASNRYELIA